MRVPRWLPLLWPLMLAAAGVDARTNWAGLEFSLHKQDNGSGNTVLVIGGIQGDEPGGFNAASLLVTHYRFSSGNVWVVPNLNFQSIVKRSRGIHGDMNRKFSTVARTDPDFAEVHRVKSIIRDPQVDYVLNLHDGSGFYRKRYLDKKHSPHRWGQSIIIDQEKISAPKNADLSSMAGRVAGIVNQNLFQPEHRIHVKNTRTADGNVEMSKTLTWYAVGVGKPAVGLEASKELPTHLRAYYHLLGIEAYLSELGIEFDRDFDLVPTVVKRVIDNNVVVSFYQNRMLLDMRNARKNLRFVPLKKDASLDFEASSPLIAILNGGKGYRVNYGNRRVTYLQPQFFEYASSAPLLNMNIDGQHERIPLGSVVEVENQFRVHRQNGFRVNVIGWRKKGVRNEAGQDIRRRRITSRFSVDKGATTFRVEVYKGNKFVGMVLVRFNTKTAEKSPLKPVTG